MAGVTKFTNYAKLWERRQIEAGRGIWTEADHGLLERYQVEDGDRDLRRDGSVHDVRRR